jgi:Transmembrane domain of unknown function (DUF3566)
VTTPDEPGASQSGDPLNGDPLGERAGAHRAATGSGRIPDASESPPWQRGATRASHPPQRPANDPPTDVRPTTPPPSLDERLNRFISGPSPSSGGPPAVREPDNVPARNEAGPAEAYASELPDLSGPIPGPTQRKSPAERPAEPAVLGASGTAARATAVPREGRASGVPVSRRARGGPVRASMQIRRIDPWSTLKVSLMLSVALFFVWMIAVAFLYLVLGGMGVWAKLNSNVGDLLNNTSGSSGELVSSGTIFGGAALIGLVNIVLLTAMATIAAFVYNLATDLIGGIEVTLADRD